MPAHKRHPSSKLTIAKVRTLRRMIKSGKRTCREMADSFGVNYVTAYLAATGKTWKHVKGDKLRSVATVGSRRR